MSASSQSEFVPVAIHRSAQPAAFADSLRRGFAQRRIDPKFHYTSARQAQRRLALHQQYSPFVTASDGTAVYDAAFDWVIAHLAGGSVQLLSLACGGAGKEFRLVQALQRAGVEISATVSDISVPLVIAGYHALTQSTRLTGTRAVVLDLLEAGDLNPLLAPEDLPGTHRLVTCFGLMPNVEPAAIAAQLASLIRKKDVLLVGANLVPEENYAQNTRTVLGDYDNAATRDWLTLLLADCGFAPDDGEIRFDVETCASLPDLLQIVGRYHLHRDRTISLNGEELKFSAGENVRLFFSNRYTPTLLKQVFATVQMNIPGEWISAEKTEGVLALTCGDGL